MIRNFQFSIFNFQKLDARRYKLNAKYGFSLVELLVVIGIIGVLATISVASLQSAQKRARDTKRISVVRGMATQIEGEDAGAPGTAIDCTGPAPCGAHADTSTVVGPSTLGDTSFTGAVDPQAPTALCTTTSSAACKFVIAKTTGAAGPLTNDYEICFYLEAGGAGLQAGMNSITSPGAKFVAGCK